ncbi:MAG: hypothetical protein COA47_09885 [Robiginitomaculum sp.]|nr:MAG: hypothetical protein COA47_09885 [Robiginitomaculum sp.]
MNWFIKVRDMVYGPYTLERMRKFSLEGRLAPNTMVADNRDQGFQPAGDISLLDEVFQPQTAKIAEQPSVSKPTSPDANNDQTSPQMRQFALMARISPDDQSRFEETLAGFGPPIQPIPGIWVLKAQTTSDQIRNVLSRDMGSNDSLLVFEISQNNAAWFNIGETADRQIRKYMASGG